MDWTEEQEQVFRHPLDAHAVVRSAPGAGKTTTLVGRVRRILDRVPPERIRVVMFNKAVQETFVARLGVPGVRVSTFDALGLEVIRVAQQQGLLSRTLQVVPELSTELARRVFAAHRDAFDDPEEIAHAVAFWKAHVVPPGHAAFPPNPALVDAYREWEEQRTAGGILRVAYEDMVYTAVGILRRHRRLLGTIDQLLIDEFQDVNPARVELVQHLMHGGTALMVAGDEDQGINEWSGAHPRFFRDFAATFPNLPTREYRLSRTFRFGPDLAQAASRLIACNVERAPGAISGGGRLGRTARVKDVATQVRALLDQGVPPRDIAVLYRGRTQGAGVLASLVGEGIPVHTEDGNLLRSGRGPDLALAYLHAATSDAPCTFDEAWLVACAPERYVQKEAFQKQFTAGGARSLKAILHGRGRAVASGQNPGGIQSLADLGRLLQAMGRCETAAEALDLLAEEVDVEAQLGMRIHSEREKETAVASFHAVRAFLAGAGTPPAEARSALAAMDPSQGRSAASCVRVCTIHKAKGLEWPHVLLPGLIEGACPAEQRGQVPGTREEPGGVAQSPWMEQERRIFFVGVTRAREVAWLHVPPEAPSRFVVELEGTPSASAKRPGRRREAATPEEVVAALTRAPLGGTTWKPKDDEDLAAWWDDGVGLAELARLLGRTPSGVASRLVRLGIVESRAEARQRG